MLRDRAKMGKRRLRRRKINDDLSALEQRLQIVGDLNTNFPHPGRFARVVPQSSMALSLNRSSQRQCGGFLDQGNQPTSHSASSPDNDDCDHGT